MSSLAWVAYSDAERRQTLDVIAQLSDQFTVDQLGIGRIRDAFSDLLFPGTSTIQTRARYFLFIPWLYQRLERRSPIDRPAERARDLEIQLIKALIRHPGNHEGLGIIGRVAQDSLVQLPSSIYWQALRTWGIRLYPRDRGAYHRLLARASLTRVERDDDGGLVPGAVASSWDPVMPDPPNDLLDAAAIDLEPHEAEYLRDCITVQVGESALADFVGSEQLMPECPYPWAIPDDVRRLLSDRNQEYLDHAEMFSLVMHGASLLYNRMLAELTERDEDRVRHEAAYADWSESVDRRRADLVEWFDSTERFWQIVSEGNPRVPSFREKTFVETWCPLVLEVGGEELAARLEVRDLIVRRERETKGGNARFANKSALEAWGGSSGAGRLDYRWGLVQQLLSDIHGGLSPTRARQA